MYKSRRNKHAGTKVLAKKEGLGGHLHPLDLLRRDREASPEEGGAQNQN